jgi:hypothetical protein
MRGIMSMAVVAFQIIAAAGQWITHVNGERVCQIKQDMPDTIEIRARLPTSIFWRTNCSNWREPQPTPMAPLPDWMRRGPGGWAQILVDGVWK